MPRIAIAGLCHESNSFVPALTGIADFRERRWHEGPEIIAAARGVRGCIAGLMDEAEETGGYEFLPAMAVAAAPSGTIAAGAWENIRDAVLRSVLDLGPVDAVYLDLHGAGSAEGCEDIEGDLLARLRAALGPGVPLVATLDLHANMTVKMVENADLLIGLICYPHTDYYDRGREAMQRLHGLLTGAERPRMALVRLPLLIPPSTTLEGPAAEVNRLCADHEAQAGVLDCNFFHGFPHCDVAAACVSVLCITDGDMALAQSSAMAVAQGIWGMRQRFDAALPAAPEGVAAALSGADFPVAINEVSDNPGSGTPGDGTHLLAALIEADAPGTVFCHIADPGAVAAAHEAGEGALIRIALGGHADGLHGPPLHVEARVICATIADWRSTGPMEPGRHYRLGRSARLKIGNVDIIVADIKVQMVNADMLALHGIDLADCRIIGLKSAHHFRAFFQDRMARIIPVDTPGLASWNLACFGHTSPARFLYPLG